MSCHLRPPMPRAYIGPPWLAAPALARGRRPMKSCLAQEQGLVVSVRVMVRATAAGLCFAKKSWASSREPLMSFLTCLYGNQHHSFIFIGMHAALLFLFLFLFT